MANDKPEPVFVGKGHVLPDKKSLSVSVCLSDIPADAIRIDKDNKKKWVTLTLRQLQTPRENQTHSLRVFYPTAPSDKK